MSRTPYTIQRIEGEWWVIEYVTGTPIRTKWHSADKAAMQYERDRMNGIYGCWSMRGRGKATTKAYRKYQQRKEI